MNTISAKLLDVAYTLKAGGSPNAARIVSDGAEEIVRLRDALKKIAERRFSDAGEPFDDALAIADAALTVKADE